MRFPEHPRVGCIVALALCLAGALACGEEPQPTGLTPLQRRHIPGQYLIGLKRGQRSSALTQLASTLAAYDPVVIPGSAPVLVLHGVDTLPDLLGRLQTLPSAVVVECLQPNYEILFDANELDISSPRDGGDRTTAATLPPGAATAAEDNAPLLGVIDTGAHIILPRMKAIVWTNPGEPEPLDGLDSDVPPNGYIDDVRGLDALTAYGNTPPLPAGTVENTNANHGTIVGAIASGVCGASHPPGSPLKIIPCVAIAGGGYDSGHFLLCLKYFLTLAERDVPLVAINASFGTTTEGDTSCEVAALRALRDEKVLFVVATGARPPDDPSFPGRHRVANVVPVASWSAPSKIVTSTYGKTVAYVAASVGFQPPVMWPFPDPDTVDLECQKNINDTASFAVPQVTNLVGRLAASAPTNSLSWFARRNLVLSGGASVDGLKDTTLSGHIVPFADALVSSPTDLSSYFNCTTATAAGRVQPIGDRHKLPTGAPLVVQAYNLECTGGAGKIPVSLKTHTCDLVTSGSCKEEIDLEDTGAQGDEISDDGLYGAEWKVPSKGWARFTVTLWPDGVADTFEVEAQ